MKKLTLFLLIALLIGCSNSAGQSESITESSDTAMDEAAAYDYAEEDVAEEIAQIVNETTASESSVPRQRIIIQNGDLEVVVPDPEAAVREISRRAVELGGWVVESNTYEYGNDLKRAYIVVRVPSEQLPFVSDEVKAGAIEIVRESVTGRDVTDEFVDLSSQLENLQATEARVQTFLDQADDVEAALAVNSELSQLQGQIAVISGRLKFLRESADYSSLSITLTPEYEAPPIEIATWRPKGTAGNAVSVLINLVQGFISFLIWFAIVGLPILLVIGGVVWGGRVVWRRMKRS